ncbi:MAG TPA: substrate-binding domain-containing protein [Nitrospirota bacterium]|nr:substrate-binding domain-containing protein [Nitrospirota bacterium]
MNKISSGIVVALTAILTVTNVSAAEITVIASNAVKEAFSELVPNFEKVSGHKVKTIWGGTVDITQRIAGGEVVDIVIVPASGIDNLIKQGRLTGNRVDFVRSGIGVAIRPGAPRPDISTGEAVKSSLLAAKSIVLSSGPSSVYLAGMFQQMGIANVIKPKMKQLAPGLSVGEALARGEGDIGFTQVSEFLAVKGIDYIGPLPADIQHLTVFSMGLHKNAPSADAAKALIKFLTAPEAAPAIRKSGMEPG